MDYQSTLIKYSRSYKEDISFRLVARIQAWLMGWPWRYAEEAYLNFTGSLREAYLCQKGIDEKNFGDGRPILQYDDLSLQVA